MTNAKRDNNQVTTLLGTNNSDGSTPELVKADPSTRAVVMEDGVDGSDLGDDNADRDDNQVPVMLAVSSDDESTPVPVYVNPATGAILIKST